MDVSASSIHTLSSSSANCSPPPSPMTSDNVLKKLPPLLLAVECASILHSSRFTYLNVAAVVAGVAIVVGAVVACIFGQFTLGIALIGVGFLAIEEGARSMLNRKATLVELMNIRNAVRETYNSLARLSNLSETGSTQGSSIAVVNAAIESMRPQASLFSVGQAKDAHDEVLNALGGLKTIPFEHADYKGAKDRVIQAMDAYTKELKRLYNENAKSLGFTVPLQTA